MQFALNHPSALEGVSMLLLVMEMELGVKVGDEVSLEMV